MIDAVHTFPRDSQYFVFKLDAMIYIPVSFKSHRIFNTENNVDIRLKLCYEPSSQN